MMWSSNLSRNSRMTFWHDLQHADICEAIQTGGQLTDELKKQIDEAAEAFKQQ